MECFHERNTTMCFLFILILDHVILGTKVNKIYNPCIFIRYRDNTTKSLFPKANKTKDQSLYVKTSENFSLIQLSPFQMKYSFKAPAHHTFQIRINGLLVLPSSYRIGSVFLLDNNLGPYRANKSRTDHNSVFARL